MLRNMSHSPMRLLSNLSKKKNLMVSLVKGQHNFPRSFRVTTSRNFCTTKEKGVEEKSGTEEKPDQEKKTEVAKFDPDEYDDYEEEPRTAGEHVAAWARLGLRLVFVLGLLGGVVFAGRELFPGRMGPNSLYSEVFDIVRIHDDIIMMTGDNMKAFGKDLGRRNEGRRTQIDSRKYKESDGSNRTRIRFNVEGTKGKVRVWAEVSDRMAANEFVYLICQDIRTGRVITIEDNRERLDAELGADSQESKDAISSLLGYWNKK